MLLKGVDKISLTTDLWKSKPQKIEYMVLTGHFVDCEWKLQKRVLNFVHLPPPRKGRDIANCIFKCLKEWDIENKVFTISVDNATANDTCIQVLKDTFSLTKRLICEGKLFHVRCCAHILNIMVQHGLKQVKTIIINVHDSVDYINQSEQRLQKFSELVQQFNLKERRLVLECKTRWNSTYDMLACAIKFKKVFARLAQEDGNYLYCPNADDWVKIEKLVDILEVFSDTTNIISGSEYPTSNLFLAEIYRIKVLLDTHSKSSDDFIKALVTNMKERFDKYWGQCNLLMAIAAVLDPRMKMKVVEITFPKMFPSDTSRENVYKVKDVLHELYNEYVIMYSPNSGESDESRGTAFVCTRGNTRGLSELLRAVRSEDTIESRKSEVDDYLDEGCYVPLEDECFDALQWWKDKSMKFRILSRLAADILAVPIATVASEATFSAGSRVIDPYRASLSSDTVQMLLCTGDWCRSLHGLKRKNKELEEAEDKNKDKELGEAEDEDRQGIKDTIEAGDGSVMNLCSLEMAIRIHPWRVLRQFGRVKKIPPQDTEVVEPELLTPGMVEDWSRRWVDRTSWTVRGTPETTRVTDAYTRDYPDVLSVVGDVPPSVFGRLGERAGVRDRLGPRVEERLPVRDRLSLAVVVPESGDEAESSRATRRRRV
ncbi:hypothetical protein RND81_11G055100 [Saponaria officinalis]|uniref:Zinc finger BED domain-containing protein RICESLEEPER 2-like n=1 Tax=Saponaria officinalis TaxID=3572 RepID=A0AAW1HH84_SAPOF